MLNHKCTIQILYKTEQLSLHPQLVIHLTGYKQMNETVFSFDNTKPHLQPDVINF